jgi:hypothetical protein
MGRYSVRMSSHTLLIRMRLKLNRSINYWTYSNPTVNSASMWTTLRIEIIRQLLCFRNDQQYALICTTPLFYVLAPTCFGSSLPSSGSFLDPSELLEINIEWVVYHKMCGYVACVPDCCGVVHCASQLSAYETTTNRHTGHVTTHYMIYHPFDLYFN